MEEKMRGLWDEILDMKQKNTYHYNEKQDSNYTDIQLKVVLSMDYSEESFTFLTDLLRQLKNLVKDRGYFERDQSYLSLAKYQFIICFDPLPMEQVELVYTNLLEILKFSQYRIDFVSNESAIQLGFSKREVFDLNAMHHRLLSFALEQEHLFHPIFEDQFKVLWNYTDYLTYQMDVTGKYLTINYLDPKRIEIRNLKHTLSGRQFCILCSRLLDILYYENLSRKERKALRLLEHRESRTEEMLETLFHPSFQNKELSHLLRKKKMVIFSLDSKVPFLLDLPKETEEEVWHLVCEQYRQKSTIS